MRGMAFGSRRAHLQHQKAASENLSQSEAALQLQPAKRTLQEWEQGRAAPRRIAHIAVESAIRSEHVSELRPMMKR